MTDVKYDEDAYREKWEASRVAMIQRLEAQMAAEGVAVVPIEPTMEMLSAAAKAWNDDSLKRTSTIWKAMIAAARKQP